MFQFPNINPIALDFGLVKISWYALSYVAGILSSWYLIIKIIKMKKIKISNKISIEKREQKEINNTPTFKNL